MHVEIIQTNMTNKMQVKFVLQKKKKQRFTKTIRRINISYVSYYQNLGIDFANFFDTIRIISKEWYKFDSESLNLKYANLFHNTFAY